MEDRYSVLIEFHDQVTADGFYTNFNGKKFSPGEVISYLQSSFMCLHFIPYRFSVFELLIVLVSFFPHFE